MITKLGGWRSVTTPVALFILVILVSLLAMACGGSKQPGQSKPKMDAKQKARMAESLLTAGRVSEALEMMDEALEMAPDNPAMNHNRGMIYLRAGRLETAEQAFLRVLEIDPYYTDAHNFLCVVYLEQERTDQAEQECRKALEDPAYPTPEKPHLNLAMLYADQGRDDESIRHLRQAVQINPKYYQAHYELASVLDRKGELREAMREYEVAAPGYRFSGEYHYRLGLVYFKLGDKDKARASLERVIDVSPGSESAAQADDLLEMLD